MAAPLVVGHFFSSTFFSNAATSAQSFFARFLLVRRKLGDGGRVAEGVEVGVFLPVLECLAEAGVFLGVVRELGPGSEVGAEARECLVLEPEANLLVELGGVLAPSPRAASGGRRPMRANA